MALVTATALGGLSGGLSVVTGVRAGFRYAGQGALSSLSGLVQSARSGNEYGFSDAARDAVLGVVAEGAGDAMSALNQAEWKQYIRKTITRLKDGSISRLASGRNVRTLQHELEMALKSKKALESFLSGLAVGLAGVASKEESRD